MNEAEAARWLDTTARFGFDARSRVLIHGCILGCVGAILQTLKQKRASHAKRSTIMKSDEDPDLPRV